MTEELSEIAENFVETGVSILGPVLIVGVVAVGLATMAKGFEE